MTRPRPLQVERRSPPQSRQRRLPRQRWRCRRDRRRLLPQRRLPRTQRLKFNGVVCALARRRHTALTRTRPTAHWKSRQRRARTREVRLQATQQQRSWKLMSGLGGPVAAAAAAALDKVVAAAVGVASMARLKVRVGSAASTSRHVESRPSCEGGRKTAAPAAAAAREGSGAGGPST